MGKREFKTFFVQKESIDLKDFIEILADQIKKGALNNGNKSSNNKKAS